MPTVTVAVAANNGDAHERGDGTSYANTTGGITMNGDTGFSDFAFTGGFHFPNVLVPNAATVTDATISFVCVGTASDDPTLDIFLEDVDNSADFGSNADVVSRVKTTASAAWVATGVAVDPSRATSPSIALPVQEVVDRAGWASGNAMMVLCRGRATGGNFIVRANEDGDATETAVLSITYAAGGGKGSGGKGKGGQTPGPGGPPKKPLRTSLSKSWKWDRGWR
jgi:hypothetical protein